MLDYEEVANDIWQLASEKRIQIMLNLLAKNSNVSVMAEELDSTVAELYRNFDKLMKSGFIIKEPSGSYKLTTYGKAICDCLPSISFLSRNKKYFSNHDFGDLPKKFIQRIGSLESGKFQKGYVKVIQQWKEICENANQYIFDLLYEEPMELIDSIMKAGKSGVKIKSIFSESTIIPNERKEIISKPAIRKFIADGIIERRMNNFKVVVILNEKEACVIFPHTNGDPDMGSIFHSSEPDFHQWCFDYFMDYWNSSQPFQESKLLDK